LQFCDASGVIEVDVRIDDQLYVFDSKTQLADVRGNLSRRFREAAIN
jgi:hypothetical protein